MKKRILSTLLITLLCGCEMNFKTSSSNSSSKTSDKITNSVLVTSSSITNVSSSSLSSSTSSESSIIDETPGIITLWVTPELLDFYANKLLEYKQLNPSFVHSFLVAGIDESEVPYYYSSSSADIMMISSENIGDMVKSLAPITNKKLLNQIENDNSDVFKKVIKAKVKNEENVYAAPCSAQSLVLYYDKSKVTEDQVKSWEGLKEAAVNASTVEKQVKATTLYGMDLYNFSWPLLSSEVGTRKTSVELYKDGIINNCNVDGDDTVSVMNWANDYFNDPNGAILYSDMWEMDIRNSNALSVVAGPWSYKSAKNILGADKLGIASLPTFTITEDYAYGEVKVGTQMKSGSFVDCSAFVMKKNSQYFRHLEKVIQYLTSKEVQEAAFVECNFLPSYKNAATEFENMDNNSSESELLKAQLEMFDYGISQPFSINKEFINNYYSEYVKWEYIEIFNTTGDNLTLLNHIKSKLSNIEYYLINGIAKK